MNHNLYVQNKLPFTNITLTRRLWYHPLLRIDLDLNLDSCSKHEWDSFFIYLNMRWLMIKSYEHTKTHQGTIYNWLTFWYLSVYEYNPKRLNKQGQVLWYNKHLSSQKTPPAINFTALSSWKLLQAHIHPAKIVLGQDIVPSASGVIPWCRRPGHA